jgi:hypothetical protein
MRSHVEAIGACNLILSSNFNLVLEKTFYVPSFSKNLIYASRLAPLGLSFKFKDSGFALVNKSGIVGYGELRDDLYSINLKNNASYNSMHVTTSLKQCVMNEKSSMLWHRRLDTSQSIELRDW